METVNKAWGGNPCHQGIPALVTIAVTNVEACSLCLPGEEIHSFDNKSLQNGNLCWRGDSWKTCDRRKQWFCTVSAALYIPFHSF